MATKQRAITMTAQALFSILAVIVGLSLGFSVKPAVRRAWRAVERRRQDL
jgi:hypothetical protein